MRVHEWVVVLAFGTRRLPPTETSRYAGTRSALPLSSSGSTGSTSTRAATRRYVELADEHLVGRRGLLEACGGIDRVACDESLPGRDVARDDLAGVDAGAVARSDTLAPIELVVELGQRSLHLDRGAHRAERVVLVEAGQAEDGHDRVADVLLDGSAVELEDRPHRVEVADMTSRSASESSRSPRLVEPLGRRRRS